MYFWIDRICPAKKLGRGWRRGTKRPPGTSADREARACHTTRAGDGLKSELKKAERRKNKEKRKRNN
jgi:hypothetical protein